MKFNRQMFLDILAMHQGNIDRKAINPIFSYVKLHFDGKFLKITSTDGQRFLEHSISNDSAECQILINGVVFYELLKKSKSKFFEIKEVYDSYKILIDDADFSFVKKTDDIFPSWIGEYEYNFSINAKILSEALKTVKWAMSIEDSRPYLNGVCLKFKEDVIDVCATDGLRIALEKIFKKTDLAGSWIISRKSVLELIKLLDEHSDNDIQLFLGKNIKVILKNEFAEIIWQSLLVAGEFPNYERVIPTSFLSSLMVNSKELLDIIERIMIMANQAQKIITLHLCNKSKVSSDNVLSSGEDYLPGVYNGEEMKILLNGRFLCEMLSNLNSDVVFEINGPHSPLAIKKLENNGSVFILAPIKQN